MQGARMQTISLRLPCACSRRALQNDGINGFDYLYPIFSGTGDRYAVTLGMMNFAATLLGLAGIAFAIYRIVTLAKNKAETEEYASVVIPLAGFVLSLVTAAFAGGAVAFCSACERVCVHSRFGRRRTVYKRGGKVHFCQFILGAWNQ